MNRPAAETLEADGYFGEVVQDSGTPHSVVVPEEEERDFLDGHPAGAPNGRRVVFGAPPRAVQFGARSLGSRVPV